MAAQPTPSVAATAVPQAVCTHWRAALAAEPGHYPSLDINTHRANAFYQAQYGPIDAAAMRTETGQARALAAHAPVADCINLHLPSVREKSAELTAAYMAALKALLAQQVSAAPCAVGCVAAARLVHQFTRMAVLCLLGFSLPPSTAHPAGHTYSAL